MSHTIMKKISLVLALVAGLTASVAANATQTVTGKITQIVNFGWNPSSANYNDNESQWVYVKVTPTSSTGVPVGCATANPAWFAFNTTTADQGDNAAQNPHTMALVMAAYNGAKTVTISGIATCSAGKEVLKSITLQ
jgi:hypothetical protein